MRKKHPIRNFFLLLLFAAVVAGLAALPLLTANQADDGTKASILAGVPEKRNLYKTLSSGAPLLSQEAALVELPSGVDVTEFLVSNGDTVHAGDYIARLDDVSVMTAVKAVQDTFDSLGKQLQTARGKIDPGLISVNDAGKLCVNGKQIEDKKLENYTKFINLSQQHRDYEELLLELFLLHRDGVLTAPSDGVVGDLDKNMIKTLSASGNYRLQLLAANTPDGDDSEVYNGFVRLVIGINEDGTWQCRTGTQPVIITDFLDMSGVSTAVSEQVDVCSAETTFAYSGGEWSVASVRAGDILLYAYAADGSYWVIRIAHVPITTDPEEPEEDPTEPSEEPEDPENPEDPTESTTPTYPGGNRPGGGINIDWSQISGMLGGMRGGSSASSSQASDLYSTEKTLLCTITPAEVMTLSLPIDEMDIAQLRVGMTADITLEALPNRSFTGTVTEINQFGSNNGGSSKFAVTLELPREEGMLSGMNAGVKFTLESLPDCLTIPVAALVEQGGKTVVFTGFDEKNETLLNPAVVTLGLSDGEYVQLLAGLKPGESFYYSYYDTVEISNAVETKGMFG